MPTWPVYSNNGAAKTMLLANHAALEVPEIVNLTAGRVLISKFTIKPSLVGSILEMRENLSLTSPLSPSPKKNITKKEQPKQKKGRNKEQRQRKKGRKPEES